MGSGLSGPSRLKCKMVNTTNVREGSPRGYNFSSSGFSLETEWRSPLRPRGQVFLSLHMGGLAREGSSVSKISLSGRAVPSSLPSFLFILIFLPSFPFALQSL